MKAYYNEFDPFAAQWLRNLIAANLLPEGEVDDRSIHEVQPDDLRGFIEVRFFAGIGGWPLALRMAGWEAGREVWTGSCPCQPFSSAGAGGGFNDPRHLWPEMFRLVHQCQPAIVFGEQVAAKSALEWLDLVFGDLEGEGYACAAADLCAAGVGAPHIRQRLYWVAQSDQGQRGSRRARPGEARGAHAQPSGRSAVGSVADSHHTGLEVRGIEPARAERAALERGGEVGFWSAADWLSCRDGKARPVEPGTFPLAHGVPSRVGRLRAYGNAIVPQVAAEFICAVERLKP